MVEVDYQPEMHRGNARFGPQHYFGAMAADVTDLYYLWSDLERRDLAVIAPRWISSSNEGEVAVWDTGWSGSTTDDNLKLKARVVDDVLEFI